MSMEKIKELRDRTLAGMMDCKKALEATGYDMDKAIQWLKEKGIAKAAKKEGAIAAEGVVNIKENSNSLVIYEINSQTDFVATNTEFLKIVDEIGEALISKQFTSLDEALEIEYKGMKVQDMVVQGTATIGEKLVLRRPTYLVKEAGKSYGAYVHTNKRVASVMVTKGGNAEIARNVAMHVTSMNPEFLDETSVPSSKIEELKAEILDAMNKDPKNASKPDAIKAKMAEGMLSKKLSDISLVDQTFVMEDMKVKQYLSNFGATADRMIRLAVGEGIEKKQENFADEVQKQLAK